MDYQKNKWWVYVEEPIRDLASESFDLLETLENTTDGKWQQLHDYSFVVFPIAKAYEGFLKKLFLDMGLISEKQYSGDRFRIGKTLNPFLPKRYQWDWVYPKLVASCRGEALPQLMWEVWKTARNQVFHYFPEHHKFVTLAQARELVMKIASVMEKALVGCRS